ncbi:NACHT domain- and WD repeat-containing protein 1-like isoform X2 [Asterias amurensis]
MRDVYPRLKDYCKSNHGLEFQVIDMRWGVRDEATDDHMTSQLCMAEIAQCQRLSVGPNFVTFLCQKYGYRPFPPKIENDEFTLLRDALIRNEKPTEKLDMWFLRDDNCVPPVYVLQPISSKLPYFNRRDEPIKSKEQQGEWWSTFELLQSQLRFAAEEAETKKVLTPEKAKKYTVSVTQDEVQHGILNAPSDQKEHCLCFVRKFSDLETKGEVREASSFIDIQSGKVDTDAQALLSNLRDNEVPRVLPSTNIIVTDLGEWSKEGVHVENKRHKEYLERFLDAFYTKMVGMVDAGVMKEKAASLDNPLHQEILQHLSFCVTKCIGFLGREDVIGEVQRYVLKWTTRKESSQEEKGLPLVLHGESGCGKTSVMAKCVSLVKQTWLSGSDAAVVIRFLGTSPNTASIQRVLETLCKQIQQVYNQSEFQVPTEYNKLVTAFVKFLQFATKAKPLVIFLDSLDQLSADHGAHRLAWLPKTLPPHVALIVSTLPKEHGILDKLKERLPNSGQYIQVTQFSPEESTTIIKSWLVTASKEMASSQFDIIAKAVNECSLPLFLKLTFDQCIKWHSYQSAEKCILASSIHDMINLIFQQLEEYHGRILVSRALAYITLSPDGLTEMELDDILSLDDDVLNDVYQFWMPPVRRIPPSLWTRIKNDISSYLVDRDADGVTVTYWYHRQFIETARQRYLSDPDLRKKLHQTCGEYFNGTWAGDRKKPCRYSALQVERFKVPAESEENRQVSSQPLQFTGLKDQVNAKYNIRKLTQLPFHLLGAEDLDSLKKFALCNFDFLLSKIKALSMQEALDDFDRVGEKKQDDELSILSSALRLSSSIISNDPDQLAPEIMGRLINATDKYPNLKELLQQASERGLVLHPMLPISTCLKPPGGMLVTSLEGHTEEVVALSISHDSRLAITGSKDTTARIWLVENGSLIHTLTGHREAVYGIEMTMDDQYCLTYSHSGEYMKSGKICYWNVETGDLIHRLKGHTGKGTSNVTISQDGKYAVAGLQTLIDYDGENEDTDCEDDEIIAEGKRQHKSNKKKELGDDWDDEDYEDEARDVVVVWNLETGRVMHWLYKQTDHINGVLSMVIDDRQIAASFSNDHTIVLWDIIKGEPLREMTDDRDLPIIKIALSDDQRLLAVHGGDVSIHSFPDFKFLGESTDPDSSSTIRAMFITKDNSRVVSGHCCGLVRVFGTGEGTERTRLLQQEYFDRESIDSMTVTPDEKYVVASCNTKSEAAVFHLHNLEVATILPHDLAVLAVDVTPDSSKILTASKDKNVRVWDLGNINASESTKELERTLAKHNDYVLLVLRMKCDDNVITTSSDGTIKVWDVRTGKVVKSLEAPEDGDCHDAAISSDDSFMVGCGSRHWYVLGLPDFDVRGAFTEMMLHVSCLVITPDDRRVAIGLQRPKFEIRICNLKTGETLQVIGLRSTSLHMLSSGLFVNQFEIQMYDESGKSKILQLIQGDTGRVSAALEHKDKVHTYAVSADETMLISGSSSTVYLWALSNASLIATMEGHGEWVKAVAFSSEGTIAASGANGGEIIIWNIQSKSLKHTITHAHESDIRQLVFSPDNRLLLSLAQDDSYVQLWDVETAQCVMRYHTYSKVRTAVISRKCNTFIVALEDGRMAFLKISPPGVKPQPELSGNRASRPADIGPTAVDHQLSPQQQGQPQSLTQSQDKPMDGSSPNRARKSSMCQII